MRRLLVWPLISLFGLSCTGFGDFWQGKNKNSIKADTTAPGIPTAFAAVSGGSTQIDLSWVASSDDQTIQPALVYEICQSATSGICGTSFTVSFTSAPGAVTFSATGLASSTAYYYQIRAKDAAGNTSLASAEATATTAAPGTVNAPTASPSGSTYNALQNVVVSSSTSGAAVCYTTDSSTPACDAAKTGCIVPALLYSAPVSITVNTTLKAIACRFGDTDSTVMTQNYTIDLVQPFISNVTSSTTDGSVGSGYPISIEVTFSEVVNVTGTPQLALATGLPAVTLANYVSGSGTATLTFSYTTASGNFTTDLDYTAANALALNGGTIIDLAANAANLTLPLPGAVGSLGANKAFAIDGVEPVVTNITGASGVFGVGVSINLQVGFSEAVSVSGSPILALSSGGTATYISGSGTNLLTFNYTVSPGENSADLDYTGTGALSGGVITDATGNAAVLTLPAPGTPGSLGANANIVIDGAVPTVVNVTASNADGVYGPGQIISIQVVFSENVVVSGTPQVYLPTVAPTISAANYASGSGTNTLTFNYLIGAGNSNTDLDYNGTSGLVLNSGTINDAALNAANLTLPAPAAPGSLGANKNIIVDGVAPVISGVTPANGAIVIDARVSYVLSETCQTASVQWTRTGGNASGNFTAPLVIAERNAGSYSMITLANSPALVAGAIYQMDFNCTDLAGNAAAPVIVSNVTFSPAGASWTAQSLPVSAVWASVAFGNGTFVAIETNTSNKAATSPDGINWTQRTLPATDTWVSVTFGNGKFVAVANSSTNVAVSADGISWSLGTLPSAASWISVSSGASLFLALALGSSTAATSTDGMVWTARALPASANWFAAAYGNGMFAAVASGGNIAASSPDGINWTQQTLPTSNSWKSIAFGNGTFVTLAQNSTDAATSVDGISWTIRTLPSAQSWQSIAFGNGVFSAPANGSTSAITSPDGIAWSSYNTLPGPFYWNSIAFGNGVFVTVAQSTTTVAVSP